MTKREQVERDDARAKLREWIKPGNTVYTILRHVSRSGMRREIGVVLIRPNGDGSVHTLHPNWLVAEATGMRVNKAGDGIIMDGAGMDMGFALVYDLSMTLFCPDKYDHDAAYSLKQEWL